MTFPHPKYVKLTTKISHRNYETQTKKAHEAASIHTEYSESMVHVMTPLIRALQRKRWIRCLGLRPAWSPD